MSPKASQQLDRTQAPKTRRAGKPEAAKTDVPDAGDQPAVAEIPEAHYRRAHAVAEVLAALEIHRQTHITSGAPIAPEPLLDCLEDVMLAVAAEPLVAWPPSAWQFLHYVAHAAAVIESRGDDWRSPVTPWPTSYWIMLGKMTAEAETLLNPPPLPQPKVVQLETLQELIDQGVRDEQIAEIYEFVDEFKRPQVSKVMAAKRGEIKPPTEKVYPPKHDGPKRQPSLAIVDSLADRFEADQALFRESMDPEPIL